MIFKFGLVVVLLFLEGAFAPEQQTTLSDVDVVSYAQRMKPLSISRLLTRYSAIRGPRSSDVNSFTSGTGQTCSWYLGVERCSLSYRTMKNLLESSSTNLAKISLEELDCLDQDSKGSCNTKRSCLWSTVLDQCEFTDLRGGHENSPCAKAAPLYFDWREARTQCRKEDSSERCNSNRLCQWDSYFRYCSYDEYFIFYGIKNFAEKFDQVPDLYDRLKTEYETPQSGDNFTWQSILHYKPSSVECPSGVEQLVCDYVVVWTISLVGMELYCPIKYASNASKCDSDVLCEWRASSAECKTTDLSYYFAEKISNLRVFIPTMSEGADRKIREADYTCELTFKRNKCKGNCIWNPNIGCRTRKDYVAALLTEPGKNTTDALCTYLKTDGFSYCHTQFSERKCERDKLCRMLPFSWCEPKEESYLAAAANEDPKLKRRYKRFKKQCWSHTTKEACAM